MKHSKRILAYSALALIVMLAMIAAIAPAASSVAFAQGVPAAPVVTTTSPTDTTIDVSWTAVTGAASYEIAAYDQTDGHRTVGTVDAPVITITDPNLVKGRTYYYWVRGINANGDGAWSDRALQVAGPAPSTPTGLTATPGFLQNAISWDAVANVDHYEVWARLSTESNNYRELDLNVSGTSYDHTGLTAGDQWYYWVRAVDSAGTMGLYAGPEITTVLAPPVLGMPSNLQAALGDTEITLTWRAPSSVPAGVTNISYEYRYRASGEAFPATWSPDTGNDLTETITGLSNVTAYDFQVRATSSIGPGAPASVSRSPATVPGVPTSFAATATHNSITLTWGAPADDGGAEVDSYRLEVLNDQSQWVALGSGTVPSTRTTYRHSGLDRAKEYQYRIYAKNVAGESSAASTSIVTRTNAPTVPSTPLAILAVPGTGTAEDGGGTVTLTWDAPALTGGSAITSYEYRFKRGDAAYPTRWTLPGLVNRVVVKNLIPGLDATASTLYTFQVQARNAAGVSLTPAESQPVAVNNTAPTAAPVLSVTRAADTPPPGGNDQFRLNWDALTSANDGNGDDSTTSIIEGYTLQWKSSAYPDGETDTTDWPEAAGDQVLATGTVNAGLYTVVHNEITSGTALLPGVIYTYRVRADNSIGGGEWSAERSVTTHYNAPLMPAPPTAKGAGANSVTVDWDAPDAGGTTITSYELQVRTTTPGEAEFDTTGDGNHAIIKNLPGTLTEYTHRGLTAGLGYFYRVRAVNSVDTGPWSLASDAAANPNPAAAGTPDPPTGVMANEAGSTVNVGWAVPTVQGALPITHLELQYQRVDDNDDGDENAADIADWSDAISITTLSPTAITYPHENAAGGATFHYRVRAVNGKGPSDWADELAGGGHVTASVDARGPAIPTLTATATGMNDILLQWNIPQNNGATITGFQLARRNAADNGWDNIDVDLDDTEVANAGPTDTQYNDAGRAAGTKYYYRILVTATDEDNTPENSAWSVLDTVGTTGAATATTETGVPSLPATFTAMTNVDAQNAAVEGEILLTWTAPGTGADEGSDGGSKITGYDINILDVSTRTWVSEASMALDDITTTRDVNGVVTGYIYVDEDLELGKTYYYILRAVNSVGNGPWTSFRAAEAGAGMPDVPVLTATAASDSAIDLSWTVPDDNGTPIVGYQIQRRNAADTGWDAAAGRGDDNTDTVTFDTDTGPTEGLNAGTKYFYRIRALTGGTDAGGEFSAKDDSTVGAASATTHGDVPGRPTMLEGDGDDEDEDRTVILTWLAPVDATNTAAVTGYSVQRWNGGTSSWVEIATPTAVTYKDTPVTPGETYYYRVAATNGQGTGEYSTPYTRVLVGALNPDAPVLTATATGPYTIELTWTIPTSNGPGPITSFVVQKWMDDPESDPVDLDWRELDVNPADSEDTTAGRSALGTQTLHVDAGLIANERYDYRIRAMRVAVMSPYGSAFARTHIGAPGKPDNASATADGENKIKLEWDAPSDSGSPINHYEISMWDTATKAWGWNGSAGAVQNVSHPVTTFTHRGLDAGTQHIYRVRAVNDATNDNGGVGAWSTIFAGRSEDASE